MVHADTFNVKYYSELAYYYRIYHNIARCFCNKNTKNVLLNLYYEILCDKRYVNSFLSNLFLYFALFVKLKNVCETPF